MIRRKHDPAASIGPSNCWTDSIVVRSVGDRRGCGLLRSLLRWNGEVGEGRAVRRFGEILTPFRPREVTIGDSASATLPGFEIHVPEHHPAVDSRGDGLAVRAEGHA